MKQDYLVLYEHKLPDEEISRVTASYPAGSMSLDETRNVSHLLSLIAWAFDHEGDEPKPCIAYRVSDKSLVDFLIFSTTTKFILTVDQEMLRTSRDWNEKRGRLVELIYAAEQLTYHLPDHREWMADWLRHRSAASNDDGSIVALECALKRDAEILRDAVKEFLASCWQWRDVA
ncbi:hypothetical protein WOC76_04820 [Methylocystis sp. IM3]|uniref:hypothetical protein n=1 Tax=unclassified Methylocystis TaxID=2625913 RepID=UPI0030F86BEF